MNIIRTVVSPRRRCGERHEHGVYVVSKLDSSEDGILAKFTRINPPIPYQVPVHRNARQVDGFAVLDRKPMNEWWLGGSQKAEINKQGDAWAIDVFGMPLAKRLSIGDCADAGDAEQALAVLLSKFRFNPYNKQVIRFLQELVHTGVNEMPKAAQHYTKLIASLQDYMHNPIVDNLMNAQAAIWRMVFTVKPSSRKEVLPNLMGLLASMGLTKDALEVAKIAKTQ